MWTQQYSLFHQGEMVSAMLAATPIFLVMLLLGLFRTSVWLAGAVGLILSFVLAVGASHMPAVSAVSAATYGASFGIFPILWIIFWALILFRITVESGRFAMIRSSVQGLTDSAMGQALLIAFGFEAFLEGAAGFGTPVAIAASLLVGLGFSPMRAAVICLLANTAPVAFGSLGIPVITLAGATNLSLHGLSLWIALLCAPIALIMPAYMLVTLGKAGAFRRFVLPAITCGATFAITQIAVVALLGPQLADLIAAVLSVVVLIVLLRSDRQAKVDAVADSAFRGSRLAELTPQDPGEIDGWKSVDAWMPYVLLVGFVLLWNIPGFQSVLNKGATRVFAWPELDGHILTNFPLTKSTQVYSARYTFNPLSAAGTACMAAAISAAIFCRLGLASFLRVLTSVVRQMAVPAATICIVLGMAFLMNYSGQTAMIGLALAHTGVVFPVFSAVLGWLGVFLTGSDTSSNALFGNLQVVTATRLHLDPTLIAASNSVGGVLGKMISLQTIAVAAAATGLDRLAQNHLFRRMLRHSIVLIVLAGALTLLAVHVTAHYGMKLR